MYNPYSKGRWYRFFVESDGNEYTLTTSDIEDTTIASTYLKLPKGYHILDRIYDINFTGAASITDVIKSYASGEESVPLPQASGFDYGYIYVFAHLKSE